MPRDEKPALSCHSRINRWNIHEGAVMLRSVARGQEFVLDCKDYPQAPGWAESLIGQHALA